MDQKKSKRPFYIILIVAILLFSTMFIELYINKSNDIEKPQESAEEKICKKAGGRWAQSSTTVGDGCDEQNATTGGMMFTWSCDCGPDKCWSNGKCIPNP